MGAKNLVPTGFQTQDHPAHSELLWCLHCLASTKNALLNQNVYHYGEAKTECVLFSLEKLKIYHATFYLQGSRVQIM
jgi:hypothetical protein